MSILASRGRGQFLRQASAAFAFFATIALILPTLAGAQKSSAPPDAWPQFRGNPSLTGVAVSAPPATLKLLWKYEVGDVIESSAAISDGVVYLGAGNGDLVALDLATGVLRWKYSEKI